MSTCTFNSSPLGIGPARRTAGYHGTLGYGGGAYPHSVHSGDAVTLVERGFVSTLRPAAHEFFSSTRPAVHKLYRYGAPELTQTTQIESRRHQIVIIRRPTIFLSLA